MNAPATPPRPLVLVVDDEVEIRSALQLGLQDEFQVDCANSAAEAESMLALAGYDAILCDHLMPGEDGLPFLIRMHGKYPHVHRIMMTSYINPEILSRSIPLAGLAACLTKPISLAELKRILHQVVGR
ncbi:MAG: response regulator [Opitutaceae bacterium]|nr:response regulator [Opitutaceae bacterium]